MSIKNNKGFLLAESLIVSTFVLTVLIFLFVQFRTLMTNHKKSYTYNTVESIYNLGSMANYLKEKEDLKVPDNTDFIEIFKNNECLNTLTNPALCESLANDMNLEYLIYTDSDINALRENINKYEFPEDIKYFIKQVNTTKVDGKRRLIAKFKNGNYSTIALDDAKKMLTIDNLITKVGTSCDGELVEDTYEPGRYIYRGHNPCNYINIKENGTDVKYRIYSIESDGTMKVIRDRSVTTMAFDVEDATRRKTGYCTLNFCSAWAAMDNYVNGSLSGTVAGLNDNSGDSSIKEYIEGTYANTLDDYSKIISKTWNISGTTSGIASKEDNLANTIADEKKTTWNGKIALLTASEYVRANSNTTTCGTLANSYSNDNTCSSTNYLYKSPSWWLLTPTPSISYNVIYVLDGSSRTASDNAKFLHGVRPSFHLCSGLVYSGEGTSESPYEIAGGSCAT